ncbi:MAG TPA: thioredoxin [Bacteroidales bacterium]|jgi:thioredoxin 1|nr:thioredoxin [Bacteroidales bacterium]MDY0160454.1 thioredoxin [Bacteroidales bacterium]HXK80935.1 thioredoxin [Bacteroidales bacterium]
MNTKRSLFLLALSIFILGLNTLAQDDSRIKVISGNSFNTDIKKGVVVVDFYADWCRPCKMLTPLLEKIAFEEEGKFTIAKLDVDKYPEISSEYGIRGIPCLIVFKDGVEVDRIVGLQTKENIIAIVNKHL